MSMPTLISSKIVKARKRYRCDYSGEVINIGDEYQREVCTYEGEIYTFRTCKEALEIIDKFDMYGKGTDNDGFNEEDYEELLWDYVGRHKLIDKYEEYDGSLHTFVYNHLKESEKE